MKTPTRIKRRQKTYRCELTHLLTGKTTWQIWKKIQVMITAAHSGYNWGNVTFVEVHITSSQTDCLKNMANGRE